jgi:glutathionylspermidine synthase
MEFDEIKAIEFIRANAAGVDSSKYDDDQLLNVIDIIWDYYEDHGLLDITLDDDDEEVDVDALVKHVAKMLAKDKGAVIALDDVKSIVEAELEYENSL